MSNKPRLARRSVAEGTAALVLRDLKITTLKVDPIGIAEQKDIAVQAKPDLHDGVSGMLIIVRDLFGIIYATKIKSPGFQNFSIAHELGHYFIDGHYEALMTRGAHVSRAGFASTDPYEQEADFFAAALLMPEVPFRRETSKHPAGLACFEAALRAHSEAGTPHKWAGTKTNLGAAYVDRLQGDRAKNMERAIACFEAALRVYSEAGTPHEWARTKTNLGIAYTDRLIGDRAENLEQTIGCFEAALRIHTEAGTPHEWARIQINLGNAYKDRLLRNRAENLEQAIGCYEAALRVCSEAETPHEWVATQANLGVTYGNRPLGERAENLEQAIACFEAALRVYSEAGTPHEWAGTKINLGNDYKNRLLGDRAENLEQAIGCFEAALRIHSEAGAPHEWAVTQNNLGNAYRDRLLGDRAENLEMAIACYEAALRVYNEAGTPQDWADTQDNLGNAYKGRLLGDRVENLERAISCFEAALRIHTEAGTPHEWARIQINLGNAYTDRLHGDRAENLEQAIGCFEAALGVFSEARTPHAWAATTTNLGNAYRGRLLGDRVENLKRAITCHEAALRIFSEARTPQDWAGTKNNLGNAYTDRLHGDQVENLERAIGCYEAALPLLRTTYPVVAVSAGLMLGASQLKLRRKSEAHAAWREALDLRDRLFAVGRSAATRAQTAGETADLVASLARLESERGDPAAAVATLERGRALGLRADLGLDEAWLGSLLPELRAPIERARGQLDALRSMPPASADGTQPARIRTWEEALRAAQTELEATLAKAREAGGFALPQGLDAAALAALAPEGGAVVLFVIAGLEGLVLLVTQEGAPVPVDLPGIGRVALRDLLIRWLEAYRQIPDEATSAEELEDKLQNSNAILVGVLDDLWKWVMEPVLDRLADLGIAGEIVLMPQGDLALLPLHAAGPRVGNELPWCVLDRHVVSYTPSGFVLSTAHERLARRKADGRLDAEGRGRSLLGLFNPMRDDARHRLPQAEEVEMPALAALFEQRDLPARCWAGPDATVKRMVDATEGARTAGYVHLACHGGFDQADPQASGLQLAGNEQFTVARIIRELRLGASRWVALSACESGMVDVQHLPDEFVGLPAAFLQAGAPGVVATLWSIYDQPTARLMGRLYESHLIDKLEPAAALREAVRWLRRLDEVPSSPQEVESAGFGSRVSDETTIIPSLHRRTTTTCGQPALARMPIIWASYTYHGV